MSRITHRARVSLFIAAFLFVVAGCSSTSPDASPPINIPTITHYPRPNPVIHEVAQSATLAPKSFSPVTATCPQGEVALGGGWNVRDHLTTVSSAQLVGSSYVVSVPFKVAPSYDVTAYVECLQGVSNATVITHTVTATVPANTPSTLATFSSLSGVCGANESLVGFGFTLPNANVEFLGAHINQVAPYLLDFEVRNHATVAIPDVSFTVDCLNSTLFHGNNVITHGLDAFAGPIAVQAFCPTNTLVAGGIFHIVASDEVTPATDFYRMHAEPTDWEVEVYAPRPYGYGLVVTALCLSLA